MKKFVAAVAAMVMAFAMAVPAFAAESSNTGNAEYVDLKLTGTGATFTKMDANSSEAQDMEAKVDEIFASYSEEIKAMGLDTSWMALEGIYTISGDASSVGFDSPDIKYGVGEVAFALQLKADGTWSLVELTWKDGYAYGNFDKDAKAFAFVTGIEKNYPTAKVESGDENIAVSELDGMRYIEVKGSFEYNKEDINAQIKDKGYDPESMEIVGFYDVSRKDGSKEGTKVTLLVDKAAPEGMKYIVLHQKDDKSWEILDVTVDKNGNLVIDFPGFSPVVLALVSDPLYQAGDGAGSNTSYKTGDNGAVAVIKAALA